MRAVAIRFARWAGQIAGRCHRRQICFGNAFLKRFHLYCTRPETIGLWRRLCCEPRQIVRATCFGPGSRQTFTAKGLAADNCPDLVAIDVDIACLHLFHNRLHPVVDAGVQAKCQPVACGIDAIDYGIQFRGFEGCDM